MFKLESYITPILLNHVTKYVKNIRPQDAQVSLWEGEVAFQNLDLRLDVLEEELNLPFEFLSGHIHELTIHVPWTKINSEPINVTINTIEFVLKLKDHNSETSNNSSTSTNEVSSTDKNDRKKKTSKVEEVQQGYMPGLVNKIINNIAINCHNIILKYVEEDIVVSMNVQLLSVHSANRDWQPAFTEISPAKFLVRKLIQISDLTICLDKRNSMGQIDVCQEPILYRCSLELRIMRKYYGNFPQSSITRVGLSTESMELNVSSLQFPMVMRLLALLLALKSGDLKSKYENDLQVSDNIDEGDTAGANGESYLSWMWNLLPSFSLEEIEIADKPEQTDGHFLDIGIYVGNLKFTLKSSEFISDSIVGATKKIRYNPILRVTLGGIFSETLIANKKNWFNTKAGVAKILVEPLGAFYDEQSNFLITTNTEILQSYLDDSVFDKNSVSKSNSKFITNPECYLEKNTEDYLIYRGPCFAADLVQYKEPVELVNLDLPLEMPTKSEQDKSITRVFAASINVKYNLTFVKILDTLQSLISTYDYPPYTESAKVSVLPTQTLIKNENKLFSSGIPLKMLEFSMYKMTLELNAREEEYNKYAKVKKQRQSLVKVKTQLPYFLIAVEILHGKWTTPLEPQSLIQSFETNPKKPKELLNELYNNYKILVTNFTIKLSDNGQKYPLICTPKCTVTIRQILNNNLALDDSVKLEANVHFETLQVKFTRPQLAVSLLLIETIKEYNYNAATKLLNSKGHTDMHNNDFNFIENTFNDVSVDILLFPKIIGCVGHVHSAQSSIRSHSKNTVPNLIFHSPENPASNNKHKNHWLKWSVQLPNKYKNTVNSLFIALQVRSYLIIMSPVLNDFLQYEDREIICETTVDTSLENDMKGTGIGEKRGLRSSIPSERNYRKISLPEETIHLSSEKDDFPEVLQSSITLTENAMTSTEIIRFVGAMRVNIDIKSGVICLVDEKTPIDTISALKSNSMEFTKIMLPTIICRSANVDDLIQNNIVFPIPKPTRGSFPWTCAISDFNISSEMKIGNKMFVHPIETNITLVLTNKKEMLGPEKNYNFTRKSEALKLNRNSRDLANERARLRTQPTEPIVANDRESLSSISLDSFSTDVNKEKRNITFSKISPQKEKFSHPNFENIMESGYKADMNIAAKKDDDKLKMQKIEYDNCNINLHIDTTPVDIEVSIEQANIIQRGMAIFGKAFRLLNRSKQNQLNVETRNSYRILEKTDEDPTIKEFLEFDTNSEESVEQSNPADKLILSVWLQWTITKITITLEGAGDRPSKATIEMEDIISSLDKHVDYVKIKNKVGTFSVRYFQLNKKNEWCLNDTLKVKMQVETSQAPFLNMIITFAQTESIFKKLFARKKSGALKRTLSEILVSMQSLEILADLDRLCEFSPVLCFLTNQSTTTNAEPVQQSQPFVVSDLPLMYIDCNGFTIYMPVPTTAQHCDVCILKIEDIKLTPNVKNPLPRLPVRADVYNKAAQMGILYTPGSIIEDRQYEICFSNISAATGNWQDILAHMNNNINNFHNTNPAFEWNRHNRSKPSVKTQQIISRFVVSVTYAPCIAYNKILICGQSIELNCITDLVVSLTTDQLTMFNCLAARITHIATLSCNKTDTLQESRSTSLSYSHKSTTEFSLDRHFNSESVGTIYSSDIHSIYREGDNLGDNADSISTTPFSSIQQSERKFKTAIYDKLKIPTDISFVAGIFVLKLYRLARSNAENVFADLMPTDEVIQSEEQLYPLISCTINQPSILISQKIYEHSVQISLFNLLVNLNENIHDKKEFGIILFDTKRGDLNFAGIAPSLISIRVKNTRSSKCEIDCNIAKPSTFHLSHKNIENLAKIWVFLSAAITLNPCFDTPRPIIRSSKIQMIRNLIFDADRFYIKIDSITLITYRPKVYEIKMVLADLRCGLNFVQRPEKLNFIGAVGAFYIQTQSKICLHPIRIKIKLDLRQEMWYSSPLISANIYVNMIHADIGVKNIQQFLSAAHHFKDTIKLTSDLLEEISHTRINKGHKVNSNFPNSSLGTHPLPEPILKKNTKNRIEFYQDDLRAGAFQFIEMNAEFGLPMPYQIQIITQNNGIICWRYPQPREIRKLYIYPVPMPDYTPVQVNCKLEYYSEVHQSFLHYCDFTISETECRKIDLPKRMVTSTIWRVIILQSFVSINEDCFKAELTEEDVNEITQIKIDDFLNAEAHKNNKLDPKYLVGCMRIDTAFNPTVVPKVEMVINLASIEINLLTQQSEEIQMPRMLKKFKIANQFSPNETFLSWIISNAKIYSSFMAHDNYTVHIDTGMHLKCLDYAYLNMHYIIEEINFQTYTEVNKLNINTNIIADMIKVNFGPGVMHSLIVSKRHWDEELINDNQIYPILPRFIVANRVNSDINFGQAGTLERLHIGRKECTMYSFRSDKHDQKLVFYMGENESEPVLIVGKNSTEFIKCGNAILVVKTKKISGTQVIVYLKAEIELLSMAAESFKLQFRNIMEDGTYAEQSPEYNIEGKARDSYTSAIYNTTQITFRLKFHGTKAKGWTGDIPLKSNKNLPWLVKVPTNEPTEFISYWVRIIRENMSNTDKSKVKRQRVLITIWPIFMIRSMFTHPINIHESSTRESIVLDGKGDTFQLSVPATHQTNHEISFLDVFSKFGADRQKADLSLKSIDWNKFFWYDEKIWTIDYTLEELAKTTRLKWPTSMDEETLIKCKTIPEYTTMPIFKYYASRDFSCSLVLEVAPWCIFTNLLANKVRLRDSTSNELFTIPSNHISTLFVVENSFRIEIDSGNVAWASSVPIFFDSTKCSDIPESKRCLINDNDKFELNFEVSRDIIFKVLLYNVCDNGKKMLILKSRYVFINNTTTLFQIIPFCCEQRETTTRTDIINVGNQYALNLPQNNITPDCQGTPIDYFYDLNAMHTRQNNTTFLFFICLKKIKGSEITIPIALNGIFNRKCFTLQHGSESIPLCVSLLENNGQHFFSIFIDSSPAILVDNKTSLNFYIAQTNGMESSSSQNVNVTPECDQMNFEWYQILRENSTLYYTPPEMFLNFPDIESLTCSISLAIFNNVNPAPTKIRWSKPITTNQSCEKFFYVPTHGDVKVIVCDKHKCIKISIFYVTQQTEFLAKDIRLRLSAPNICDEKLEDVTENQSKDSKLSIKEKRETITKNPSDVECCQHLSDSKNSRPLIKLNLFIKEFSLNPFIVSKTNYSMKMEICSIYLEDIQLTIDENKRDAELIISNLQMDNQLFSSGSYDFPVVVCPEKMFKYCSRMPSVYRMSKDLERFKANALIQVHMKLYEDSFELRSINLKLNPLRAYLEDTYLNDLFDYILEFEPNNIAAQSPSSHMSTIEMEQSSLFVPKEIEIQAQYLSEPLKLRSFRMETIHVMLSVHTCVRLYIALDHSPLEFSTYERQNILTLPIRFGHTLGMHYLSGALFGAGWVVGSLEILGSPSGLARSFSLGLRDFVSMPAQGLLRGPWGFIVGVTQGSASLLRNITAGTVNSVTKLAASVARNIDRLTLDDEHFQRTEALRRLRPQGFTEGFSQGMTGLGISILGAVGGIARHTLEAKSPVEVMTGVGRGIVGAFTKPISGAAELVALTGQGVLHTVGFNAMPTQRRVTLNRNTSLYPADGKFWKLLPKILFTDQILFYNAATLVKGDHLKKVCICLTSSVLAVMEHDRDELRFILPVDKIQAEYDPNDRTLILVRLQQSTSEYTEDENKDFTTKRIMNFLISSEQSKPQISWDSLEDILTANKTNKNLDFSFYISENLGAHLLNYLKILNSINNK